MALARACDWLEVPDGHPFGLQTLPYGSFSDAHHPAHRRVGVAVGDRVLNLTAAAERLLPGRADDFSSGSLDRFLAAGDGAWAQVRAALTEWLSHDHYRSAIEDLLVPAADVTMHLPFTVADYVDFYASEQHATNVGRIFRPDGEPLTPNWRHLPIGYHGRAGTVVVSGTPIRRPCGQTRPSGSPAPLYGVCRRLDFEAELGFVVGAESAHRRAGSCRTVRRARVRRVPGERLVGAGHPGLGISAARAVPRKILWHNHFAVDSAARRAGAREGAATFPGYRAGQLPGRLGRLGTGHRVRGAD